MNNRLLQGVPKDELERAKESLQRLLADPAMDYVRQAVRLQRRKSKSVDYDNPSWAYKQAHDNGFNEALHIVEALIKDKE